MKRIFSKFSFFVIFYHQLHMSKCRLVVENALFYFSCKKWLSPLRISEVNKTNIANNKFVYCRSFFGFFDLVVLSCSPHLGAFRSRPVVLKPCSRIATRNEFWDTLSFEHSIHTLWPHDQCSLVCLSRCVHHPHEHEGPPLASAAKDHSPRQRAD